MNANWGIFGSLLPMSKPTASYSCEELLESSWEAVMIKSSPLAKRFGASMTKQPEKSRTQSTNDPYPPSWIDRLIVWIDHLPGPAWIFYLLGVLGLAIFINAAFWIDGSMPAGAVDPEFTGYSIFILYWVGLYQYLTGVGSRSLKTFSPLIGSDDPEIKRLDYQLATLPRWLGRLSILLGFGFSTAMALGDPAPYGDIVPRTAIPYVADIAISGFMISAFICLIIRSVRQLRLVGRLHVRATNINLLKLDPAHAFSVLTSRTGMGIIFVVVSSLPLDDTPLSSPLDIFLTLLALSLAIIVFVLPIIGIRHQLEEEKKRFLNETNDLLLTASDRLHNLIRGDDYRDVDGTRDAMEALIRERELIGKISTWPWDLNTLRSFTSALLLPVIIWLVTRLLDIYLSF